MVIRVFIKLATNGQGLLQGWNSLLVRPEPLLIKDIKVQVNKQKPKIECPAQMKHNSDKMTIAPMSSQPCSKPNVCVQSSWLCDESRSLDGRRGATFTIKPVACCVILRNEVVNDATGASVRADRTEKRL